MFWEKFCSLCTIKGKSPNTVALEIGIKSSGTVTGWKNGAIPRASVLQKLSIYFDVPVSYFTDANVQKEKPTAEDSGEPNGYSDLTPENQEFINQMIAKLLASQSQQ